MRKYLLAFALSLMLVSPVFVSPVLAAPCPVLTVVFGDNLPVDYQIDHDNCVFYWDASNHDFDYAEVLEYVDEYDSEQTTAIAVGGYWARWLLDIQETEGYFDNVIFLRAKGL